MASRRPPPHTASSHRGGYGPRGSRPNDPRAYPPPPEEHYATDIVHLNVGGQHFDTLYETLLHHRSTYFETFLQVSDSGRIQVLRHNVIVDREGRIFINRDPKLFAHVLQYMRDGHRALELFPHDPTLLKQLHREAEFFAMPKFAQSLLEKAEEAERKKADREQQAASIQSVLNQINNSLYVNSFRK